MTKDEINVEGENTTVPEEAAGSPKRGTIWALISVGTFVLILALVFFFFLSKSATDGKPNETPAQMEQKRQ